MPRTVLQGRMSHSLRSLLALLCVSAEVLMRRSINRPMVRQWSIPFEIGTLFYRHQFKHALAMESIAEGRAYFDSLYNIAEPEPLVDIVPNPPHEPRGDWFIPRGHSSQSTILHFHGGGYAFYATVSRRFIAMLAQRLQVPIFAPDYRLTPEHSHPAQIEDAIAAYRYLLDHAVEPHKIVVTGDSAGGHLALMTLLALKAANLPQPALAVGISPWTDIGCRGESLFGNDCYDMVQGEQTLMYSRWLKGDRDCSNEDLSPVAQDFRGTAPIYLQAGGKEILVDMIRDFAHILHAQGVAVRLDVWQHMTHEFHGYGATLEQSREAIDRIQAAIVWATESPSVARFDATAHTEVDAWAHRLAECQMVQSLQPEERKC